jgi:hypothetical protein
MAVGSVREVVRYRLALPRGLGEDLQSRRETFAQLGEVALYAPAAGKERRCDEESVGHGRIICRGCRKEI